jgi:hypothetical protein
VERFDSISNRLGHSLYLFRPTVKRWLSFLFLLLLGQQYNPIQKPPNNDLQILVNAINSRLGGQTPVTPKLGKGTSTNVTGNYVRGECFVGGILMDCPVPGSGPGGPLDLSNYVGPVGITGNQTNGGDQISSVNLNSRIDPRTYGAKCDGVTNDTTAIQNAINAASAGNQIVFPALSCKLSTSLTIKPGVALIGAGYDPNGTKGTTLLGTAGVDTIIFPTTGLSSPFDIENLNITGGLNAIHLQSGVSNGFATYVTLRNLYLKGSNAGLLNNSKAEEWVVDNVYFNQGTYGIQQSGTAYFQKSSFSNLTMTGQAGNCMNLQNDGSVVNLSLLFSGRMICQTAQQTGVFIDEPLNDIVFYNLSTEANGQSGKSNTTTCTISSGSNSATCVNTSGISVNDVVTIRGAGAANADYTGTVCVNAANVLTLDTNSGCTVPQNAGTSVNAAMTTNATYDDVQFGYANGGGHSRVVFVNYLPGGSGAAGHIRYSMNQPPGNTTVINSISAGMTNYYYDPSSSLRLVGGSVDVQSAGLSGTQTGIVSAASFTQSVNNVCALFAADAGGTSRCLLLVDSAGTLNLGFATQVMYSLNSIVSQPNGNGDLGANGHAWRDGWFTRSMGVGVSADGTNGHIGALQLALSSGGVINSTGGAVPTLSSCGTSPSAVSGTNITGQFTTGTGAPTACTITFATAPQSGMTAAPRCQWQDNTASPVTVSDAPTVAPTATDVLTLSAAATSHVLKYHCDWQG